MIFFKTQEESPRTPWKRPGRYQNSTLRFTPGEDFPAHLEKMIGRPLIMRCFVTLNDVWDYRTGEYTYDYVIGYDRYADDTSMPVYDRDESKLSPYGLTFLQYLRSHAEHADEVCLSIRRYEQEVRCGKLSIETYEKVLEHVLEYYKECVPNICYIECNEPNFYQFGAMRPFEFYQIHKCLYRVVNRLNAKHRYDKPLLLGGPCFAGSNPKENEEFLRLYALDPDPDKRLDFFSAHAYTTDMTIVPKFYDWLKKMLSELNLPDLPVHWNEYGATDFCSPNPKHNQINAALSIEMMITMCDRTDLFIYPWCSYHDPDIQVDRTQYIDFNRATGYLPTFLGQAYIALSKLLDYKLEVQGNLLGKGVVTTDGEKYAVLVTNSTDTPENVRFALTDINKSTVNVKVYTVDALHNNCFIDRSVTDLHETDSYDAPVVNGQVEIAQKMDAYGFTLWIVE